MFELSELKLIILENPYDLMEKSQVRDLFSRMVELKVKGYRHEYDYGVMPVDSTDFIANHIMICLESEEGFKPVCAYRSLSLQRSMAFKAQFPALALAKERGSSALVREVQEMIDFSLANGRGLSYDSSWTVDPELRKERKNNRIFLELLMALCVLYHRDYNLPDWITAGILRLETHEVFYRMGLVPFENDPVIKHPAVHDEEAIFVKLKENSEAALEMAEKYKALWKERVVYAAGLSPAADTLF